jgi:hypothetical protein
MQRTRHQTETPPTGTGAAERFAAERRITTLEARVEHLEATLEAFQDAVYRQSVLEGRRIAELRKRTAPHEMARALSQDARRHGV